MPGRRSNKLKQVIDPMLARALAHPLRGHILVTLGEVGDASPKEIGLELGIPVTEVSYHFRELERKKLIEQVRTEPRRGFVEHFYELTSPLMYFDDVEWMRIPAPIRASISAELITNIAEEALTALEDETLNAHNSHLSRTWIRVDDQARDELARANEEALERIMSIRQACAKRLQGASQAGATVTAVLACFETTPGTGGERAEPPGGS